MYLLHLRGARQASVLVDNKTDMAPSVVRSADRLQTVRSNNKHQSDYCASEQLSAARDCCVGRCVCFIIQPYLINAVFHGCGVVMFVGLTPDQRVLPT